MQRLFEKFDIEKCLKKDDYTAVYAARHIYLGKQMLLKTLCCHNLPDQTVLVRFKREAQVLAQLDHPNIIKVLDFGLYAENFYISFEFFPGRNLRRVEKEKLDNKTKDAMFVQMLKAVEYAHRHNVIHRDLKPENILVGADFHVKVADFGLALLSDENQMTLKSSIVGTPGYMSPEQIRGEKPAPQSDLFSLGILALELYGGKNPFLGADVGTTINNILTAGYDDINRTISALPGPVDRALALLLARDRKKRAGSAKEILDLFGVSTQTKARVPRRNNKLLPALAGLALIALLVAVGFNDRKNQIPVGRPVIKPDTAVTAVKQKPLREEQPPLSVETGPREPPAPVMTQATGHIAVMCLPWADVFIDSTRIATTPMEKSVPLAFGEYELALKHPSYPVYRKNIVIGPQKELLFKVNLDTLFGYLDCKVFPWANIYVDGDFKGHTPTKPIILEPGEHLLTLQNPNFSSAERRINITRLDTLDFRFSFEN